MNDLDHYAKNLFFTIEVAHDKVQKYVFVLIQRMKAVNNPNLANIILATEARWQDLFGNLQTYDADLNLQRGLTKDVNITVSQFMYKALKLEPLVESIFDKGTDKYLEFFPHGRTEFHDLTLSNVLVVMNRLVSSTHKYTVEIAGTFTNWQKVPLIYEHMTRVWQLALQNIPINRTHHYMLLADGKPVQDKHCDGTAIPNGAQELQFAIATAVTLGMVAPFSPLRETPLLMLQQYPDVTYCI